MHKYPNLRLDSVLSLANPITDTGYNCPVKETVLGRLNKIDGISAFKFHSRVGGIESGFTAEYPLCRRTYKQFIGEDVTFECQLDAWYRTHSRNKDYKAKWILNRLEIVNEKRFSMTCNTIGYSYAEILRVSSIDENNFGEYQLWFSYNITHSNMQNHTLMEYMIAQMFLYQADFIVNYVYVPVGNAVLLRYMIPFDSFLADDALRFEYETDSKLIGKTTLEKQSKRFEEGCTIFTNIVLWDVAVNKLKWDYYQNCMTILLCTPSISFGKHSITVSKFFLDKTANSKQLEKVFLPTKYIVLPEKPFYTENQSYDEFQTVKDINAIDLSNEEKNWFFRNLSEFVRMMFLNCLLLFIGENIFKFLKHVNPILYAVLCQYVLGYTDGFIWNSNSGYLGNIIENPNYSDMTKYDILCISTENDHSFIQKLIPCLEKNKYKVCVPERDFRAGMSKCELYSTAIQNSLSIIVLCSEEFLNDPFLHQMVFNDFILGQSECGKIRNNKILLIKMAHCNIPDVLKNKFPFIDSTEMRTKETDTLRIISDWAETIFPWYFRLVKFCVLHYYIIICLFISASVTNFFFVFFKNEMNTDNGGVSYFQSLLWFIALLIDIFISFIHCVCVFVRFHKKTSDEWKYYFERHLTGIVILDELLLPSDGFLFSK
ncbi:unnamed protein product [Mytilus coruscus]|uniref:TIR domain-containing protein n=1 Tax=Mytilus coruscus TaxID=42192 RepID=A0A6J8BWI4_MYTCO|nr:unnamed protein product [Mytilus coruscus]